MIDAKALAPLTRGQFPCWGERSYVMGILNETPIGFGNNGAQNLQLNNQIDRLKPLNYPILLGTSRKGFIGQVLGGLPAAERLKGTATTVALGIDRGADIVRVHDVKEMVRVARITDAIVRMKAGG